MTVYVIRSSPDNSTVYSNISVIEQVDRDEDSSTYNLIESGFYPALRIVVKSWECLEVRW